MSQLLDQEGLTNIRTLSGGMTNIRILSLDAATHDCMNVHSMKLWNFLLDIARSGHLIALLLRPAVRDMELREIRGHASSTTRCMLSGGLPGLTLRELLQVSVGNTLLLRGLWLSVAVALHGGAAVLEHPAVPYELHKPSVWRAALVLLWLRRPNALFFQKAIQQWRYGSPALTGIEKPSTPLIGRSDDGTFRTSAAKEYPAALNQALAMAFLSGSSIRRLPRPACLERTVEEALGAELAQLSACLDGGSYLPDFLYLQNYNMAQ